MKGTYPKNPRMGFFSKSYKKAPHEGAWGANAQRAARVAIAGWGKYIGSIGTYSGHMPTMGRAVDIMRMNNMCEGPNLDEFWDMAYFFQDYYKEFNIAYIIFRDSIWSVANDVQNGRPHVRKDQWRNDGYNNGDCNNVHMNHIHISFDAGDTHNNGLKRPIPPHLLEKRRPKAIRVSFAWGDDQGSKNVTSDKKSPQFAMREIDLTKRKPDGWSNAKYIWAAMRNWGITEQAVAGIMGNLNQESGLDPSINEGGGGPGWGLAQWSFERRPRLINWLKSQNLGAGSLEGQVRYIWREMNRDYKSLVPILKNSNTTVEEATEKFHRIYEGSNDNAAQIQERVVDAKRFYKQFKGTTFHQEKVATGEQAVEAPKEALPLSILPTGIYTVAVLAPTDLGSVAFLPPVPAEDDDGDDALTDLDDI